MDNKTNKLKNATKKFWDENPCGIQADTNLKRIQRYSMEPYLPELLEKIASEGGKILEVGCGQGIDGIQICKNLLSGKYVGIDLSSISIEKAEVARKASPFLACEPKFVIGDCENLSFKSNYFDSIWSMGVLHHTPKIEKAISEIHRTLKKDKTARIMVYRTFSLKVMVAKALRIMQYFFSVGLQSKTIFYKLLRERKSHSEKFGTMFLECFGSPLINSYTKKQIINLFYQFSKVEISTYSSNFGSLSKKKMGVNKFGYFFLITAKK